MEFFDADYCRVIMVSYRWFKNGAITELPQGLVRFRSKSSARVYVENN